MGISGRARRLIGGGADDPAGIGAVEAVSVEMSTVVRELLVAGDTYLGDAPVAKPRGETWSDPALSGGGYHRRRCRQSRASRRRGFAS